MRILKIVSICATLFLSACAAASAGAPATQEQADPTALMAQALATARNEAAAASATPTPPGSAAPSPEVLEPGTPAATQPPAEPTSTPTPAGSPTPDTRILPKYWPEWPLLPTVSARAREIFLKGQALGNNPHAFSVIGDCQAEPGVLMGTYDSSDYQLGEEYTYLEETIQQFKGSFDRDNITVKDGMSVASVFAPAWADPAQCSEKETPLECEFRIHKPAIVIISLGTNWRGGDEKKHAAYLRRIVDYAVDQGVVPVLSSKGDNLEGDHRINRSIAEIAYDYELPFWNFWLTLRDLPGKGIDGTRPGGYLIPDAWGRRSFTGLQALDAVWRGLKPLLE